MRINQHMEYTSSNADHQHASICFPTKSFLMSMDYIVLFSENEKKA